MPASPALKALLAAQAAPAPVLDMDFTRTQSLPAYFTSSGASNGQRINSAGSYQSSGAPRFNFSPSTLLCRGLLVEEARTNSVRNGTFVTGTVAGGIGTTGTLPTNMSVSMPVGVTGTIESQSSHRGVDYVQLSFSGTPVVGNLTIFLETATGIAAADAQVWMSSVFLTRTAGSFAGITSHSLGLSENTAAGATVVTAEQAISIGTSDLILQRYEQSRTLAGGGTVGALRPYITFACDGTAIDFTIRIGFAQAERITTNLIYASSPVGTVTAALTRTIDVNTALLSSIPLTTSIGVSAAATFETFTEATSGSPLQHGLSIDNGTSQHRLQLRTLRNTTTFTDGAWLATVLTANVVGINISGTTPRVMRGAIGASVSAGGRCISVVPGNAQTYRGQTPVGPLVATTMRLGLNEANGSPLNGHIERVSLWNVALSGAALRRQCIS